MTLLIVTLQIHSYFKNIGSITPANLYKLYEFDGRYAFGSSAMNYAIAQGPVFMVDLSAVSVL
jgi:hypothetical protein